MPLHMQYTCTEHYLYYITYKVCIIHGIVVMYMHIIIMCANHMEVMTNGELHQVLQTSCKQYVAQFGDINDIIVYSLLADGKQPSQSFARQRGMLTTTPICTCTCLYMYMLVFLCTACDCYSDCILCDFEQ